MTQVKGRGDELDYRGNKRSKFWSVLDPVSMTVQSDAKSADIQEIIKQFTSTGIVTSLNDAQAVFMDITQFDDFTDAMRHANLAEQEFMKLPSKTREIFHHDVLEWLDTAFDKEKRDALVEKGIITNKKSAVQSGAAGTGQTPGGPTAPQGEAGGAGAPGAAAGAARAQGAEGSGEVEQV